MIFHSLTICQQFQSGPACCCCNQRWNSCVQIQGLEAQGSSTSWNPWSVQKCWRWSQCDALLLPVHSSWGDLSVADVKVHNNLYQVVNHPKHKSICYHPSLLPRHRGASAISWTLIGTFSMMKISCSKSQHYRGRHQRRIFYILPWWRPGYRRPTSH